MGVRKNKKTGPGTIEDCICYEFDSGFNIDQICDSLLMTEELVIKVLKKSGRLK